MSGEPDIGSGRRAGGPGRLELLAGLATLLWLGAVAGLWQAGTGESGAGPAVALIGAAVPVALIWLAVASLRGLRELRTEAAALRAAIDSLQRGATPPGGAAAAERAPPAPGTGSAETAALARQLEQLLTAHRRIEAALARLTPPAATAERTAALSPTPTAAPEPGPGMAEPQAMLALGTPEADHPPPVTVTDFLRALNFPDTAEDRDGFAALRRALKDPRAARLIRAAQDVLTLLSEDGLYMDDLTPERTAPELWRRFARGERGEAVAALGAIDAPDSLARAAARLREDAVFRDVAHHFLRHFDRMLEAFEPGARDDDLLRLADTRSGRAFMLLGRVTGIFG